MTNNNNKNKDFDVDALYQRLALILSLTCVRNTVIEKYHAGKFPVSKTGDYSDVTVMTPEGEIPWNEVSRISDEEMKAFNKEVSNRIFTFLQLMYNYKYVEDKNDFLTKMELFFPDKWDTPEMDAFFVSILKSTEKKEESILKSF